MTCCCPRPRRRPPPTPSASLPTRTATAASRQRNIAPPERRSSRGIEPALKFNLRHRCSTRPMSAGPVQPPVRRGPLIRDRLPRGGGRSGTDHHLQGLALVHHAV